MLFPLLLTLMTRENGISIQPSYATLGEISSALTAAGVKTEVTKSISDRVYGVCLQGVNASDVVQVLKKDESLKVEEGGGKISISLSSETNNVYQQERANFVKNLKDGLTKVYSAANKTLLSIYAVQDPEARDTEEAQLLSTLPKPLSVSDRLIFESSRYQDMPRFPLVRVPILAIPTLSASGSSQSKTESLADSIGYVSPMRETKDGPVPYTDSRSQGSFIGTIIGSDTESHADKLKRFQTINTRVSSRWDPQDLRAECSFEMEVSAANKEGQNYPGRYAITVFRTALANPKGATARDKILLPSHLAKMQPLIAESEKSLKTDSVFAGESTWTPNRALISDSILEYVKSHHQNILFPVSPFYNVAIDRVAKESLGSLLTRAVSSKAFDSDAQNRSYMRLGVPSFDSAIPPSFHPSWLVWHSGSIWSIASDVRCFDPLSDAAILDVDLANHRLKGDAIDAPQLLEAIAKRRNWAKNLLPSNESLSWGDTTGLLPFARLFVGSQRVKGSVGLSSNRFRVSADERKILSDAFSEMDEIHAPKGDDVRGQVAAGRVLYEDGDRIWLSMTHHDKRQTFSLLFDGEPIWQAAVELP